MPEWLRVHLNNLFLADNCFHVVCNIPRISTKTRQTWTPKLQMFSQNDHKAVSDHAVSISMSLGEGFMSSNLGIYLLYFYRVLQTIGNLLLCSNQPVKGERTKLSLLKLSTYTVVYNFWDLQMYSWNQQHLFSFLFGCSLLSKDDCCRKLERPNTRTKHQITKQ